MTRERDENEDFPMLQSFKELCRIQMAIIRDQVTDHEKRIRFLERIITIGAGAALIIKYLFKL